VAWLVPALLVCLFVSGATGLIYQVLWLRLLALSFGVTIYAASTVLASFMAGLALGSIVAGRLIDRASRPLLWYGLAEILVGGLAFATPAALAAVERVYVEAYPALSYAPLAVTAARFGLAFLVLVLPTALMGATLPIVIKAATAGSAGAGARSGVLYATNTAGAIFGTVVAGFYLIGGEGISASFRLAASLNVVVGLAACLLAVGLRAPRSGEAEPTTFATRNASPVDANNASKLGRHERGLLLLVFVLSGFASLALEVVWFRMLLLFMEVTTYAFSVMLATVLSGIAIGSYVVAPFIRRARDWLAGLALLEMGIGVASALSLTALARSYDLLGRGAHLPGVLGDPSLGAMLVPSFFAIFPASMLFGAAFPVGLHLFAFGGPGAERSRGERVGRFYSLNVLGAILGSLAGGFLLLPTFGTGHSLVGLGLISLVSGLLLLRVVRRTRPRFAVGMAGLGSAIFAASVLTMPDPFTVALAYSFPGQQLLWREEGLQTTVSIQRDPRGNLTMYLDGSHQASERPGEVSLHNLIGGLPLVLHDNPREALVIGLGGGVTPGAASRHLGVDVDLIELSETVVHGSEWFRHVNNDVLRRPNVHLRIDDGRNYLLLTPQRYDVITADVVYPHHAGAGNLYSAEYYRLARAALKEDGLMMQWIDQEDDAQYRLLMRTFLSVFPETTLWAKGSLLVGSKLPLELDPAAFERKLHDPTARPLLDALGLDTFDSLANLYTAGPQEMARYLGAGPILTDDRPMGEYFLSVPAGGRQVDLSGLSGSPPVRGL
jgi:spermidine synthase